jgi:hypothetical protein
MRTCTLGNPVSQQNHKKKSGKNRDGHPKKKYRNIRYVPIRTCVHVHTLKEITALALFLSISSHDVTLPSIEVLRRPFFSHLCAKRGRPFLSPPPLPSQIIIMVKYLLAALSSLKASSMTNDDINRDSEAATPT